MSQEVEKYSKPTRILHWVHLVSFCILFLTGLVLFIPQLGFLAQDSVTRVIHRIGAAIFIIAPLIYIPMNWQATKRGIKEAFSWGASDIGWLKAAPRYYFLGDEKGMPPQGSMNTGQRLWWLIQSRNFQPVYLSLLNKIDLVFSCNSLRVCFFLVWLMRIIWIPKHGWTY